jgi:hypothetical protein
MTNTSNPLVGKTPYVKVQIALQITRWHTIRVAFIKKVALYYFGKRVGAQRFNKLPVGYAQ